MPVNFACYSEVSVPCSVRLSQSVPVLCLLQWSITTLLILPLTVSAYYFCLLQWSITNLLSLPITVSACYFACYSEYQYPVDFACYSQCLLTLLVTVEYHYPAKFAYYSQCLLTLLVTVSISILLILPVTVSAC